LLTYNLKFKDKQTVPKNKTANAVTNSPKNTPKTKITPKFIKYPLKKFPDKVIIYKYTICRKREKVCFIAAG
ncbi:MAG: hypothetical protein K2J76_07765, partial [Oscillospiraceae bacterium]|nr:hypothetical protein [Oscillospiraceae bacterium]